MGVGNPIVAALRSDLAAARQRIAVFEDGRRRLIDERTDADQRANRLQEAFDKQPHALPTAPEPETVAELPAETARSR